MNFHFITHHVFFIFNEGLQTVFNEITVGKQNPLTAEEWTSIVMTYLLSGPSSCSEVHLCRLDTEFLSPVFLDFNGPDTNVP